MLRNSCILIVLFATFCVHSSAQASLQEKLDAKRDAFAQKAAPEMQEDFKTGIELVESSGVLQMAKQVGDIAPDFALNSADGQYISLKDRLKYGPVVLLWYRGEWCPYCNIQLQEYQQYLRAFESAGATLIAISPQAHQYTISTKDKNALGFYVLSDSKSQVAERYGIAFRLPTVVQKHFEGRIDLDTFNSDDSRRLPLSATYVIDKDGMITYAFIDADYRKRAEPSVVLDEVKKLR